MNSLIGIILCGLTLMAAGCSHLPLTGARAGDLRIVPLEWADAGAPFAVSPDGRLLAAVDDGLRIRPIPAGPGRPVAGPRPTELVWSADATRLAMASTAGTGSRLAVHGADGALQAEQTVPGEVVALYWPGNGPVVAVSVELAPYSFGTGCRVVLVRWAPGQPPEFEQLQEAMLKPATVRQLGVAGVKRLVVPVLVPLGDELVYARLHDPPAFAPYRSLVVRNLATARERELMSLGLQAVDMQATPDSDAVLVGDEQGRLTRLPLWEGEPVAQPPLPGRLQGIGPDGRHLLAGGRLLLDGREVAGFPAGATGRFLADGRVLVSWNGRLFLVERSGLAEARAGMSADTVDKLRTLRAWRARGLVTGPEFRSARERLVP